DIVYRGPWVERPPPGGCEPRTYEPPPRARATQAPQHPPVVHLEKIGQTQSRQLVSCGQARPASSAPCRWHRLRAEYGMHQDEVAASRAWLQRPTTASSR